MLGTELDDRADVLRGLGIHNNISRDSGVVALVPSMLQAHFVLSGRASYAGDAKQQQQQQQQQQQSTDQEALSIHCPRQRDSQALPPECSTDAPPQSATTLFLRE
jgi:hypothetical protein